MQYKAVPIHPVQKDKENATHVAQEFENLLNRYQQEGWDYVRTESLKTWVDGDKGCFGIGAKPGFYSERQMVIFKK